MSISLKNKQILLDDVIIKLYPFNLAYQPYKVLIDNGNHKNKTKKSIKNEFQYPFKKNHIT